MPGCPIRKSADQFVCANPRSLSQLITSFFASESLGIHRLPLSILSPFRTQTICKSTDGCILIAIFCSTLFSRFLTNYVNDRLMVNHHKLLIRNRFLDKLRLTI